MRQCIHPEDEAIVEHGGPSAFESTVNENRRIPDSYLRSASRFQVRFALMAEGNALCTRSNIAAGGDPELLRT